MIIIKPSVEIISEQDNMKRIEVCARTCYKSEEKIGPGTAETFCQMLIGRGHTAMLEHSNIILVMPFNSPAAIILGDAVRLYEAQTRKPIMLRATRQSDDRYIVSGNVRAWREIIPYSDGTLWFENNLLFSDIEVKPLTSGNLTQYIVSPDALTAEERAGHDIITARFICAEGVSLEMFRHRIAAADCYEAPAVTVSPAQESTRYVDYGDGEIRYIEPWWWEERPEWRARFESACQHSELEYKGLRADGAPPQAARVALNKAVKTEIVLTQTPERWRDWLALREAPNAHPDMQICARMFREAAIEWGML